MPPAAPRIPADRVGVAGARPWGAGVGNLPTDARASVYTPHGGSDAVRYVSDAPYEVPYNERPLCIGTRTNGEPCKAKAEPSRLTCRSHLSQE